jgi:Sec-independent protein secretion pathway component TatC
MDVQDLRTESHTMIATSLIILFISILLVRFTSRQTRRGHRIR